MKHANDNTYITKAKLDNGNLEKYDFCSEFRNSYQELEENKDIKYLGTGVIYSINNVKQNFTENKHFWAKTSTF